MLTPNHHMQSISSRLNTNELIRACLLVYLTTFDLEVNCATSNLYRSE